MEWYSPWALLLLLLLPPVGYFMLRKKRRAAVRFPSLVDMRNSAISWRLRLRPVLVALRLLCLALLILALARPRKGTVLSEVSTEGVAIEAVVDRSGSMSTEMDYYGEKLNRMEVVKRVLSAFIEGDKKDLAGRPSDLIGLVTFTRYADTVCPLVLSHGVLTEFLRQMQIVTIESENYTAIGDAISLGAARLRKAEEEIQRRNTQLGSVAGQQTQPADVPAFKIKSKAIILLTDGLDNASRHRSPLGAAELARKWGIRVYTIGIGSDITVGRELDEDLLTKIAEKTGGFYGRADDAEALRKIVKRIDEMEKTEVKTMQYTQYEERFGWWTLPALALLGLEMLAACTVFRKIP